MFRSEYRDALVQITDNLSRMQHEMRVMRAEMQVLLDFVSPRGQEASITDEEDRWRIADYITKAGLELPSKHTNGGGAASALADYMSLFWHADNVRYLADLQHKPLPRWFVDKYSEHLRLNENTMIEAVHPS